MMMYLTLAIVMLAAVVVMLIIAKQIWDIGDPW